MRVAPRRLDGWEPRRLTEYERDASGNVVRAVEYLEPEWDDEQVQLMTAYKRFVDDIGPHGHLMSEATSPEADPNNYDSPLRFVAEAPYTDWARKAQLDREAEWREAAGDKANMNGLIFPVRKVGG